MRTRVSPTMRALAAKVGKVGLLKKLLSPIYTAYKRNIQSRRNRLFRENGVNVLKEYDAILSSIDVQYSVFAGTLLGAVREKGFLKHDVDIDTVIFNCDYTPKIKHALEQNGFKLVHYYLIDNGDKGREETYEKNGVSIDIFYIYSDEKYPTYQCDFHALDGSTSHEDSMTKYGYVATRRIEFPVSHKVTRIQFEDISVNAISNANEWLEYRYGKNYMIPDPDFRDKGDNPHIFEWTEVKAIMKY